MLKVNQQTLYYKGQILKLDSDIVLDKNSTPLVYFLLFHYVSKNIPQVESAKILSTKYYFNDRQLKVFSLYDILYFIFCKLKNS